jgi:hypothetical protein
MARRTTPSRRSLVSLLVVGMLCILAISAVPRASADGDIGITVNVDVLGTSDSPTPSVTATATSSASTTPGGETSIGGVLFVSGLTMRYTPSINPLDGRVDMRFTVRNAYKKPLDGKATFWVTAWFGNTVGHQIEVSVPDIAPGETRLVTATIRGVGQWGILTGPVPRFGDSDGRHSYGHHPVHPLVPCRLSRRGVRLLVRCATSESLV